MREWKGRVEELTGWFQAGDGASRAASRQGQVRDLLNLADQLQGILLPVEPASSYRRRLHGEVVLEGQQRQPAVLKQHRKGILLGAAVGSLASLAGLIIALVLRSRHSRLTHVA